MKFNFTAFFATVVAVIVSGVFAFMEGTLTNKRVTMGFLNHAGMWGDLILISTVTGLVVPYLVKKGVVVIPSVCVAVALTVIAHIHWANRDGNTEHMFPTHETGKWYLDMSGAGWMHVIVMSLLFSVVFIYTFSPMPTKTVIMVSCLLTLHVFIATVQPAWYCTGKLWVWWIFGPPLTLAALIWIIAALKIQLAKENP